MPPTLSARHRSSNRPFGMVLGRIGTWFRQRRDTHLLESLSDDQLKDIGVSRAQIEGIVRHHSASRWRT